MKRIAAFLFALCFFLGWLSNRWENSSEAPLSSLPEATPVAATEEALQKIMQQIAEPPGKPDHLGAYERAQISRLVSLKRLQGQHGVEQKALAAYRKILSDRKESWVIQRQALQNALLLSKHMSDQEREKLIASVSPTLLLQAGKTEEELLAEFMRHAKR